MIAAVWHVANDLIQTIACWGVYTSPLPVLAAWGIFTAVGAGAAITLLRADRAIRNPWILASVLLTVVGMVAVICDAGIISPANWPWGAAGWFAILLFWRRRPVRALLAFSGLVHGITLGALVFTHHLNGVAFARYLVVAVGTTILQIGFIAGATALRAAANWIATASAARAETVTRREAADEIHSARQQRSEALRGVVADLLTDLADNSGDPADPLVRHRCAAEAARLRRLLVETDDLPDPLVHELRACADVAERRGVVVDLLVLGQIPTLLVELRRALTDPPVEVLTAAESTARVTVVGSAFRVVISIIADASLDTPALSSHPAVELTYHHEGERLWVETAWQDPSPSLSSTTIPSSSTASDHGSTMIEPAKYR
jgi:hypothetical protein